MSERNISPVQYWKELLHEARPTLPCPVDNLHAYQEWRPRFEAKFRELLGTLPEPAPLEWETTQTEDTGSYLRHRVLYQSERHMWVPAYLLVPKDRQKPGPAVLAQHGHGRGKADVAGLPRTPEDGEDRYNHDYAHQLAVRGYVVLAPDLRCFGERLDETPSHLSACDFHFVMGAMFGINLLALDNWDLQRGIDLLCQHPLVDPERIGIVGLSQGGTMTLFTAAADPRIKAAVCSGYFNSFLDFPALPWNMCGSMMLFGMLQWGDHLELAGLIAPRPFLIEQGVQDSTFPFEATKREFEKLAKLYETLGARERLDCDIFEGGHRFHGGKAFDWFARWL